MHMPQYLQHNNNLEQLVLHLDLHCSLMHLLVRPSFRDPSSLANHLSAVAARFGIGGDFWLDGLWNPNRPVEARPKA